MTKTTKPGSATRQRDRMPPDPGQTQERDKSGGLKGATKTRKQNEATKTGKKRDLENKARKTPLEGARRRNYTTGARPKKNGTEKTQRANRIHLSNEKGPRPEKTGLCPKRRPENAAGNWDDATGNWLQSAQRESRAIA